jgi:hypothetical protein
VKKDDDLPKDNDPLKDHDPSKAINPSKDDKEPGYVLELPSPVISDWIPTSKTAIAQRSYKVLIFPKLLVASVNFYAVNSETPERECVGYTLIYSRSLNNNNKAMDQLFDMQFQRVKNIVAINRHIGHNHIDVIIPAFDLALEAISGNVPITSCLRRRRSVKQRRVLAS